MPKYRTTIPTFIAPDLVPPGTVIDFEGTPSITFEPLDDEAEAALNSLFKAKPQAAIKPFDELASNGGAPGDVGTIAQPGKAAPGLTEGGKALDIK